MEWKPVIGYEGIYEVSYDGQVRTHADKVTQSELHGTRHWKQRVLKQKTDKNGYKRVMLYKEKRAKTILVHRLVAEAFLINGKNLKLINHIDANTGNNHVSNLEWCNHRDNLLHAYQNDLNKKPDKIVLVDKQTNVARYFYSKAEASRFLGKNHGYVSGALKKGRSEIFNYDIYIKPNRKEGAGK